MTTRREFMGSLGALGTLGMMGGRGVWAAQAPKPALPSKAQQLWADQELGMFFHYDIPIFVRGGRAFGNVPDAKVYNPAQLDCDQWMAAAKAYGAKYVVFVAKHGSGFLQWQSDAYPYNCKQATNWRGGKGDVVKEFCDAARRNGLKPGIYGNLTTNEYLRYRNGHVIDDKGPLGARPEAEKGYARACEKIVEELWSHYGELFEIWFDGGVKPPSLGGPDVMPILEKYQPQAVLFQGPKTSKNLIRWVGNERGVAPYPCWSTDGKITQEDGTKEFKFPGTPDGAIWCPGECDVPLKVASWMCTDRGRFWTMDELLSMYDCSVGRNCNLLLNAAPQPNGLIAENEMKMYAEFGRRIRALYANLLGRTEGEGVELELALAKDKGPVDQVVLAERIDQGERVRAFTVEALVGDAWREVYRGSCIGHKHILRFAPVAAAKLRLKIAQSADKPLIREFSAYRVAK